MNEEWRPVVGWEGLYEVSDQGRVRSFDRTVHCKNGRTRRYKGRLLKPQKSRDGYLRVALCRGDKPRRRYIHRLVLAAFAGPCPDGMETRHMNGNPSDNRLANLQYGTHSENNLDRVKHGTHQETRKTHCPRGHKLTPGNLRKSRETRGWRECLACDRARGYIQYRPELRDQFQRVADRYYQAIFKEGD